MVKSIGNIVKKSADTFKYPGKQKIDAEQKNIPSHRHAGLAFYREFVLADGDFFNQPPENRLRVLIIKRIFNRLLRIL